MTNGMTVTEMTDQIVAQCDGGEFQTSYTAPLSLDMKEVMTLMQIFDHASDIIESDRGMNPASAEFFNRFTVMLLGRLLGLNKQYIALQNAAVQDQAENTVLPDDDDGESWKVTE